ncbi:putative hemolysin [Dyella silvae]|uniref:putative hemolysin n=1 Tax=Dyella silvae TaxID=2994424 RepID=UPI00226555DD|nr:DUF333 domain-containing protein [Dyella silvae]
MKTALIALMVALLAACSTQQTAAPTAPALVGLPNPASVNCEKLGGNLDMRKDAAGNEGGICIFPDGRECEEWALFRDHTCVPMPASTTKDSKS